jgi:hypothetical protein
MISLWLPGTMFLLKIPSVGVLMILHVVSWKSMKACYIKCLTLYDPMKQVWILLVSSMVYLYWRGKGSSHPQPEFNSMENPDELFGYKDGWKLLLSSLVTGLTRRQGLDDMLLSDWSRAQMMDFLSENICLWTKIQRLRVKKTNSFVPKQCFGRSNMLNILDKTFVRRLWMNPTKSQNILRV